VPAGRPLHQTGMLTVRRQLPPPLAFPAGACPPLLQAVGIGPPARVCAPPSAPLLAPQHGPPSPPLPLDPTQQVTLVKTWAEGPATCYHLDLRLVNTSGATLPGPAVLVTPALGAAYSQSWNCHARQGASGR